MIRNTFLMLDGIGEKTERLLWQKGILNWDSFLSAEKLPRSVLDKRDLYEEMLLFFSHELDQHNEKPFAEFIRKGDQWRLYPTFKKHALCFDIETNGLPSWAGGEITVVGFYDGYQFRQYVKGINLTEDAIQKEVGSCKLLISYYGTVFDLPFLKKQFPSLKALDIPHFDLCFAGRKAGLRGGLKKIEVSLGLQRDNEIHDLTGYDAVRLWNRWNAGDREALLRLRGYNKADTVNLREIADIIFDRLFEQSGFRFFYEKFSDQ